MTLVHTLSAIAALTLATMAPSTWAASGAPHDSHYLAPTTAVLVAQAKTPEERMQMRMDRTQSRPMTK